VFRGVRLSPEIRLGCTRAEGHCKGRLISEAATKQRAFAAAHTRTFGLGQLREQASKIAVIWQGALPLPAKNNKRSCRSNNYLELAFYWDCVYAVCDAATVRLMRYRGARGAEVEIGIGMGI